MSIDQENGTRLTTAEILRELRHDSAEHGRALAVLQTQNDAIQRLLQRSTEQYDLLSQRTRDTESADVDIRARLTTLEGRPAMTPDEREALKAKVTEHERRIATNETKIHDANLRDLTIDQKDDLRRYLSDRKRRGKWWDDLTLGAVFQIMSPIGLILALSIAHFAGW